MANIMRYFALTSNLYELARSVQPRRTSLALAGSFLVACAHPSEGGSAVESTGALDNGIEAKLWNVRVVTAVDASDGCTATVVGPRRLLLAALCVVARTRGTASLLPTYGAGARIRVSKRDATSGRWADDALFDSFTVLRTDLPAAAAGVNAAWPDDESEPCAGLACVERLGVELAIITTKEDLGVNGLAVSTSEVAAGADLVVVGAGGEREAAGVDERFSIREGTTRAAYTTDFDEWTRELGAGRAEAGFAVQALIADRKHLVSLGSGSAPPDGPVYADLELGDSGGPAFADGRVVGVLSLSRFGDYNVHAGLSGEAKPWIEATLCPATEGKRFGAGSAGANCECADGTYDRAGDSCRPDPDPPPPVCPQNCGSGCMTGTNTCCSDPGPQPGGGGFGYGLTSDAEGCPHWTLVCSGC